MSKYLIGSSEYIGSKDKTKEERIASAVQEFKRNMVAAKKARKRNKNRSVSNQQDINTSQYLLREMKKKQRSNEMKKKQRSNEIHPKKPQSPKVKHIIRITNLGKLTLPKVENLLTSRGVKIKKQSGGYKGLIKREVKDYFYNNPQAEVYQKGPVSATRVGLMVRIIY